MSSNYSFNGSNELYETSDCTSSESLPRWHSSVRTIIKLQQASSCFHTLRDMYWDLSIPQEKIQLGKKLGSGQFGTVVKCHYEGTTFAAKFLKQQFVNTEDETMFLKELSLMKKLQHPNIVAYIGTGHQNFESQNQVFIAQECINGGSLQRLLLRQSINLGRPLYSTLDAFNWACDIAKGLRYLHSSLPMVIHRDLKLENVLLDQNKNRTKAVLVDFGLHALISQHIVRKTNVYKLTGKTGSYIYMAPEVFLKQAYNEKVDVFSFGIIMWELFSQYLISVKVAPNGTPQEVINYAVKSAFGKRQPVPTHWPQQLQHLVQQCWHQDPSERPPFNIICTKLREMQLEITDWHMQQNNKFACCTIM